MQILYERLSNYILHMYLCTFIRVLRLNAAVENKELYYSFIYSAVSLIFVSGFRFEFDGLFI